MTGSLVFLAIIIFGLPLGYYLWDALAKRRMHQRLKANWGKPEALRKLDGDELRDVAHFYQAFRQLQPPALEVDDTTWDDLDMDSLFLHLDTAMSITGSEVLYTMLHEQGTEEGTLQARQQLAQACLADDALRQQVQTALSCIGRSAYHGAWRYLFAPSFQRPKHLWLYPVLAVLPTLFLLLGLFHIIFFLLAAGAFAINLFVHFKSQANWQKEVTALRHLGAVLKVAKRMTNIKHPAFTKQQEGLRRHSSHLRPIRFWLPLFGMQSIGDMAIVLEYIKIFFMLDMLSLVAIVNTINRHIDEVRACYTAIGEIDACLSIAQLYARTPALCQPQFVKEKGMNSSGLYHPLVKGAVRNNLHWQRNILLSGSNASGKSTFIKALALNIILAQSLYLCFADSFVMCRGQAKSAMAVRDNISLGESYFIVEIKSLKRMVDQDNSGMLYCFIDEILRGTNTIERIAASSAVLEQLVSPRLLCMVATHDIELTRILNNSYDNLHFSEVVDDAGLRFDYLL